MWCGVNREEFVEEIRKIARESDLDDVTMSEYADVSVPTIRRWKSGKNVPHELMRDGIVASLKKEIAGDQE